VIAFSELHRDPRVRRQIDALRQTHQVLAAGLSDPEIPGVAFIPCTRFPRTLATKISEAVELALHQYERHYWSLPHVVDLQGKLVAVEFDLIVANDIEALPLALRAAGTRPIVIDAHEYAPREREDKLVWRLTRQGLAQHICSRYLKRASAMLTVCEGLAQEYRRNFGVDPVVVPNAAPSHPLSPSPTRDDTLRMIHHGVAVPSRGLEQMIEVMRYVDARFHLDLMLLPQSQPYLDLLSTLANRVPRTRILPPAPMHDLVRIGNGYDLGLYLLQPTNFNNLHALPNKFFEFIQSRLAVAIGPSPEMARIVKEYECGVVARDFSPASMAKALCELTTEGVDRMKHGSHAAAQVLNAERNADSIRSVVNAVLSGRR
jgi:glycosyltransferase involved in cell wall biosynthesis